VSKLRLTWTSWAALLAVLAIAGVGLTRSCRRSRSSGGARDETTGSSSAGSVHTADPRRLPEAEFRYGVSPTRNSAVRYQPDVVLIEHGAEAIRGAGSDGLTWTLAADAPHAAELVPGKILFASSRAVGRVLAIRRSGDELTVTLGPVALTDVIRDATLRYDGPLDLSSMIAYTAPDYPGAWAEGPKLIQSSDAGSKGETTVALASLSSNGALTPMRAAWLVNGPSSAPWSEADRARFRSLMLGHEIQAPSPGQGQGSAEAPAPAVGPPPQVSIGDFEMTPFCCGGLGIKVVHNAENVKILAFAVLRLQQPSLHFNLDIQAGKVRTAEVQLWGASGLTVQFEAGTPVGVSGNIRRTFFVPVDLSIPIIGLAVPFAVNVRQTFLLETAFSAQNSTLKAIGDYAFQGHIYMGYHQGSWGAGAPTSLTSRYNLANTLGGTSVGVNGLVMGYGGRVIVGIGAFGFVTGPYLGYNTSVGVTRGSNLNAILVPRCRSSVLDISMKVGIGYSIPQPVTNAINFLLRALNVKTIESEGGIGHTEPVVHKTDVTPAGCTPP